MTAAGEAEEALSADILANKAAGDAFRDEIADRKRQEAYDVQTEVYKRTPFGARRIDIDVWRNGENLGGIETKLGAGRYTVSQRAKDAWLTRFGGYVVNVVRGQ